MSWNLAQVNIARTHAPFSAPAMAGLNSRIAEMNALAESSPGFVWRFTEESGADNQLDVFSDYFVPFDRDLPLPSPNRFRLRLHLRLTRSSTANSIYASCHYCPGN